MIRTVCICVWIVLSTIVLGLATIVLAGVHPHWGHRVARVWARGILLASRIRVTVSGLANLPPGGSCVVMANHQSNYDIPVVLAHLPVQFRWLAKAELFRIPLFGAAMRRAGYISIDRSDRREAIRSLKRAAAVIREGVSVLVFPEGTRSTDGRIRPFKKGGFYLALDAGAPILPLVIKGTRRIMPKESFRIRPGRVSLQVRPPIPTRGMSRRELDALVNSVRTEIRREFERPAA